jgi:hypothetical protein
MAGSDATTVSAYDLLSEEDRKALAWVRERGGLDAVEKRLMPEGMEWPKHTDGELVRIGGCWGEDGCDTSITYIERIIFAEDGVYLDNEYNEAFYRHGERVERPAPKVLDADGVEIRAGDTVWCTNGHGPFEVTRIVYTDQLRVICDDEKNGHLNVFPERITHRAPVLAADGKPLREGETVWGTGREEHEYVILGQPGLGGGAGRFKVACHDVTDDIDCDCDPDLLTHEQPDTWERLEEDAGKEACEYFAHMTCGCETSEMLDETVEKCNAAKARDLVRRCKALAERGA